MIHTVYNITLMRLRKRAGFGGDGTSRPDFEEASKWDPPLACLRVGFVLAKQASSERIITLSRCNNNKLQVYRTKLQAASLTGRKCVPVGAEVRYRCIPLTERMERIRCYAPLRRSATIGVLRLALHSMLPSPCGEVRDAAEARTFMASSLTTTNARKAACEREPERHQLVSLCFLVGVFAQDAGNALLLKRQV